jgi:hypothetical protein
MNDSNNLAPEPSVPETPKVCQTGSKTAQVCQREKVPYHLTERGRATRRAYALRHREKENADRRRKRTEYANRNPQKVRARWLVGNAVRKGYLTPPETDRNWHNRWEFHHPDHSRPFYGVWLSPSEHRLVDMGHIPCPLCVDYTEHVRQCVLLEWGLLGVDVSNLAA